MLFMFHLLFKTILKFKYFCSYSFPSPSSSISFPPCYPTNFKFFQKILDNTPSKQPNTSNQENKIKICPKKRKGKISLTT